MPKTELIDENGAEGNTMRADQPFGRDLVVKFKNALELLVEVSDGMGTELMKDPAYG